MRITMNGIEYLIKEVEQDEFEDNGENTKENGYFFGQTHFDTQEIWVYKHLPEKKKRRTLYHELIHVYLKEFVTTRDIEFPEEVLCDISANSHDIIHKIVDQYIEWCNKIDKFEKSDIIGI